MSDKGIILVQHTEQEILDLQRNTYDLDNMIAYAWRINKYIRPGATVMDIGCGLGHQTYQIYQLKPQCCYIMLDIHGVELENKDSFSSLGYAHNDLQLTKQFVKSHMSKYILVDDIRYYAWDQNIDVAISTLSWGWHYPLELYLDKVLKHKPGYIIFDSRTTQEEIPGYECMDTFKMNRKENTMVFKCL